MTIAHVTYGMGMGGVESMLADITHFQAQLGHSVHIVVINDIFDDSVVAAIDPQVHLHRMGRRQGSKNPWPLLKMNVCLKGINPDIIHLHFASISKYILLPGLKKKMCNTLHSLCRENNTDNIEHAGPVFAISEAVAEDLQHKMGLSSTVVKNGINPHIFKQREHRRPSKPIRLVQVARLDHNFKGQDTLLYAVGKLKNKGYDVDLSLIGDGASMQMLKELAHSLEIADRVHFLGNKPREFVYQHLADYDIMVHPSRIEGFGLTVAEGMAAGLPVVVSDNDGPMEIIGHGRYGKHFPVGNIDVCVGMIMETIDNYPTQHQLDEARQRVITDFSIENTTKKYINYYKQIIK